jgi:hypothetical protein
MRTFPVARLTKYGAVVMVQVLLLVVITGKGVLARTASRAAKLGVALFERSDPICKGILAESDDVGSIVFVRDEIGKSAVSAPLNWLECDGRFVSALEYPKLARALHERVADKDGKLMIRLPDLSGCYVYEPPMIGEADLVSMLSCTHELKEALDSPLDNPTDQAAIVELAKNNRRNQRITAYIRSK